MYGVRHGPRRNVTQARGPANRGRSGDTEMTQPLDRDIREEAATWHARLASGEASVQDYLQFEQWIADPACRAAYDNIQSVIFELEDNADALSKALSAPGSITKGSAWSRPRAGRAWNVRNVLGGAVAAAATLAAAFFLVIDRPGGTVPAEGVVYAAGPEATRTVTLADNTEIMLNRGAEVTVYWTRTERRAVLSDGEAAFRVQHDADRPMSVIAGNDEIRDVGTVFNVLKDGTRLTVTVAEGEVAVISPEQPAQRVHADYQYEIDHTNDSASLQPAQPEDVMAWQNGRLVYHAAPLSDVIQDLNRYSDQPIHIADPGAANLLFSGALRIEPAGAMLDTLEKFLPIDVKETGGTFVVESRE